MLAVDFLPSGQVANARYWIAECVKATKLEAYLRILSRDIHAPSPINDAGKGTNQPAGV